ncbi:MAG: DUF2341 domain-containing protein, partial [Dehalococcoidia bacterium]
MKNRRNRIITTVVLTAILAVGVQALACAAGINVPSDSTLNLKTATLTAKGDVSFAGTITATTGAISLTGNWTNTGLFTCGTSTVTLTGTANQTITPNSNSFYNLTFNGLGSWTLDATLDVDGDFAITQGTVNANAQAMTVAGDWSNSGTFTPSNNSVTLNGTLQTIYGSSTFYQLAKTTDTEDTLAFEYGTTQTVTNSLNLAGADSQYLFFLSDSTNQQADLDTTGASVTASYLDVRDSNSAVLISPTNSTDSGNNNNWFFGAGAIGISGSVYTDDTASTPVSDGTMINLVINGTGMTWSDGTSGGLYNFTGKTISEGDVLCVWIDGADPGNTVTASDGYNLSGLDIYQGNVIVRNDNGTDNATTAMLAIADNTWDSGIVFSVDASNNLTVGISSNDVEFYVPSDETFVASGNITVGDSSTASDVEVLGILQLDDWWDINYQYRKRITITNNSSTDELAQGFSTYVEIDHAGLVGNSKSQADGDDIRIVYNGKELDRLIDDDATDYGWNQADSRIWFKTQNAIAASGTDNNYWVYYKNDSAANPPADGNKVYYFYDSFEGTLAENIDSSLWSWDSPHNPVYDNTHVRTGTTALKLSGNENCGGDPSHYISAEKVIFSAWLYDDDSNYESMLGTAHWANIGIYSTGTYYKKRMGIDVDGSYVDTTVLRSTGWHQLKMISNGTDVKFYIDDTLVHTHNDIPLFDRIFVGNTHTANVVDYFDDVIVRKYLTDEPSCGLGSEGEASASANDLSVYGNLVTSGTLTVGSSSVSVGGDFTNTGSFYSATSTVTLNSSSANQTITTNNDSFYNLTLNNTASTGSDNIYLADSLEVRNNLTVTDGVLDTKDAGWWDTDWSSRKKLIFTQDANQAGALVDFPVMVHIDLADTDFWDNVTTDGYDVRFIDVDGASLNFHFEKFNHTSDDMVAWVKIPKVSRYGVTDYIYLYYGNGSATTDPQNEAATWDNNYSAVWHMNEASGPTVSDSKGANNGTATGCTFAQTGIIGEAIYFDGSDYVTLTEDTLPSSGDITVSMWVNATTHDANRCWMHYHVNDTYAKFTFASSDRGSGRTVAKSGNDTDFCSGPPTNNDWTQITAVFHADDGGLGSLYKDGGINYNYRNIASGYTNDGLSFSGTDTIIGKLGSGSYYYLGYIDEVRISNVERSGQWLKAEYLAGSDAFLSYGAHKTQASPGGNIVSVSGDLSVASISTLKLNDSIVDLGADVTLSGTLDGGTSSVTFDATSAKTITSGSQSFYNAVFNGTGGGWTIQDAFSVSNDLTVTAGTLSSSTNSISVTGNSTVNGGTIDADNVVNITGNLTVSSGTLDASASTCDLDTGGNITLTGGNLSAPAVTDASFTVGGNFEVSGTGIFTHNNGKLTFDDTVGGKTITTSSSGADDFYQLTFNGSGGHWTFQDAVTIEDDLTISIGDVVAAGAVSVTDAFSMSDGTFNLAGYDLSLASYSQTGGTFVAGASSISCTGDFSVTDGTYTANTSAL